MPQYLSPGVYIEEVPSGNQPIVGVSTSTPGIVGMAEWGPVNIPILVTSYAEYQQTFGGYLPITEFSNNGVAHCYMPHAVEGFFTNSGSLAYIVRCIDSSAPSASTYLFDRGTTASPDTLLLRRASALTGTIAVPPALCILDDTGLTVPGTWFRVDQGSNSEYKQADAGAAAENAMVSLDFPLNRSHASGATIGDYQWATGPTTQLVVDANGNPNIPAGELSLELTSTLATDISTALGLTLPQPIQIGTDIPGQVRREYRYVTNIIKIDANHIEVVLDSPLALAYNDQTPISWITLQTPPISSQALGDDASAGDSLIWASAELIAFQSTTDLIVVDDGTTTKELRRIGQAAQIGLSLPSYTDYPAGSIVEEDGIPGSYTLAVPANAGDTDVVLTGPVSIPSDTQFAIIGGGLGELLAISGVSSAELVNVPGAGLANPHAAGVTVELNLKLAADFTGGTSIASLQDTAGITIGSTLVFTDGGPSQSMVVTGVNTYNDHVTFSTSAASTYASGTATVTETLTLLEAATAGETEIVLEGYHGLTAGLSLTIADGTPETFVLTEGTAIATEVSLSTALANSYPVAGTIVTADSVLTAAILAGAALLVATSDDGLVVGMQMIIDVNGASPETVTIRTITASAAVPPTYTITFSPPVAFNHDAFTSVIEPAPMVLTAAVTAGSASNILSVNSRLGVNVGDLLMIGASPNQEYATVYLMPLPGPAPNAGTFVLSTALQQSYAAGALVVRVGTPPVANAGTVQPTATPIDTPAGSYLTAENTAYLLVDDGSNSTGGPFSTGDVIRVTTPTGQAYFHMVSATAAPIAPGEVYVEAPVLENAHAAGSPVVGRDPLINVQALSPGTWGNRLQVSVQDEPSGLVSQTSLSTIIDSTHIKLQSASGVQVGTILELYDPTTGLTILPDLKVAALSQTDFTITLQSPLTVQQTSAQAATPNGLGVRSREFQITVNLLVRPNPAVPSRNTQIQDSETFRWLSMDPRHSNYLETIIGDIDGPINTATNQPQGQSNYIRVHDLAQDIINPIVQQATLWSVRLGPENLIDTLPNGTQRPAVQYLENGDDAVDMVSDNTYVGLDNVDPVNRTGLFSLENIDNVSILACPGQVGPVIQQALIDQSENLLYRMAVLDGPPPPYDTLAAVQAQRQNFDSEYAALYHPWLLIPDPFPTNLNNIAQFPIPPSGHTMGVYARVDDLRGVFKAPANELIYGITGLQRTLNQSEQDILNPFPVNINVNRDFTSTNNGYRIYGARIITSDSDMKYVPVRRTLMYLEQSLYQGLQWVVFEPNDEKLWARIRRTISNFLTTVWSNGGLQGSTPAQAFYVQCDNTTMTQTEIDNGELIALVGVAPVYPAEFVIVRIGLWTSNAS